MDEWIASLESTFTEIASMVERVGEFKDVVEAVRKQSSELAKLSDGVNKYIAMVDETKAYMDTQSKALKEALALAKAMLTWSRTDPHRGWARMSLRWWCGKWAWAMCCWPSSTLSDHRESRPRAPGVSGSSPCA